MQLLIYILFTYFLFATLYILFFSIAALFTSKNTSYVAHEEKSKILILVPAYKEDNVIYHVATELLNQNYPKENFDLVIIGDSLKESTNLKLKQLDLKLLTVNFEKSTKVKSLKYALDNSDSDYDIAVICDADNVLEVDFLNKVNNLFLNGESIIQARRVAKNLDSSYSILDATSEIINNHIFRKGHNAVGLSSSLIGSGMAFKYSLLKENLSKTNAVGGFDRELQLHLISNKRKISYLENALVFDEKVDNPESFENQRKRWLSSQFIFLRKYFFKGLNELAKGNFDYFNLSVLSNLFLPRSINLGLLFIFSIIFIILKDFSGFPSFLWPTLFATYIFALVLAIPLQFYNKTFIKAVLNFPSAFLLMLGSLFKLKGANKTFIHTPHTKVDVQENIFSKHES